MLPRLTLRRLAPCWLFARPAMLAAMIAAAVTCAPSSLRAADECPCDCYFGFDCVPGEFCDWTDLFSEDECWWRTPKPNAVPGAGCDGDYPSYGQCDGRCVPLGAAAHSLVGGEDRAAVRLGVRAWADAMTGVSLAGGGSLTPAWRKRLNAVPLKQDATLTILRRAVGDALLLARGQAYVGETEPGFQLWDLTVADLRAEPVAVRNGNAAIAILLAEMQQTGSGLGHLAGIDPAGLDGPLYERLCPGVDRRACLYGRLADMGAVLGGHGVSAATAAAGGGVVPPCGGCPGDTIPSDGVDFQDLLDVLYHWGAEDYPAADIDLSGNVDMADLLIVLAGWGACA